VGTATGVEVRVARMGEGESVSMSEFRGGISACFLFSFCKSEGLDFSLQVLGAAAFGH
jgi:hypothetical protein